jgi:hypothetical protein
LYSYRQKYNCVPRSSVPEESYIKGWHLLSGTLVFTLSRATPTLSHSRGLTHARTQLREHSNSHPHVCSNIIFVSLRTLIHLRFIQTLFIHFIHSTLSPLHSVQTCSRRRHSNSLRSDIPRLRLTLSLRSPQRGPVAHAPYLELSLLSTILKTSMRIYL